MYRTESKLFDVCINQFGITLMDRMDRMELSLKVEGGEEKSERVVVQGGRL